MEIHAWLPDSALISLCVLPSLPGDLTAADPGDRTFYVKILYCVCKGKAERRTSEIFEGVHGEKRVRPKPWEMFAASLAVLPASVFCPQNIELGSNTPAFLNSPSVLASSS